MAASVPLRLSATVQDERGIKANVNAHVFIDPAQTVTAIDTALAAWVVALDAITGGQVIRNSASIIPALPGGIKSAPVAGSEVEEVATFDFTQSGTPYHYGNVVPSFLESLETAAHKPDLTNAAVLAYTTLLTTSPVLGGYYSGPGNDQLLALAYAFLSVRKHRRAERAVSLTHP